MKFQKKRISNKSVMTIWRFDLQDVTSEGVTTVNVNFDPYLIHQ